MQPAAVLEFEYLIIGGGSAGCVLANRLSARAEVRVGLVEAGIDTPPGNVPADILHTFPRAALNSRYKWPRLLATLSSTSRGPTPLDQGKVMGGSSSINFQAANRGFPDDYDEWSRAGATGWNWSGVLPYFRRLERDADFDGALHGHDGPVPVQRMPRDQWCGFSEAVAQTCAAAGLPFLDDQNACFDDGHFAAAQSNLPDRRISMAMAYLDESVRARPNLTILAETLVDKILFEARRATGARAVMSGAAIQLRARETIVCAGAIHTPALLMRSGIGPGTPLQALDIPVVADIPGVGANLREHPGVPVLAYLIRPARLQHGTRPLQVALRYSSRLSDCPPHDMYASVFCRAAWHGVGARLGMIMTWVNKAYSAGRVALCSPRMEDEPAVDLDLCADPRDLRRLVEGMRFIASLYRREPLRQVAPHSFPAPFSARSRAAMAPSLSNGVVMGILGSLLDGPAALRSFLIDRVITETYSLNALMADTDALESFVRATATGLKHVSGTCRIGHEADTASVTAPDGRVRQVDGLRIADASLMPTLPRANTNLPTVMIAEKIADSIH